MPPKGPLPQRQRGATLIREPGGEGVPAYHPLRWHLLASLLLALIDGVATLALLLLCYFLFRAYRLSRSELFLFFFLGFSVLAAGETARTLMLVAAFLANSPPLAFFLVHGAGPAPLLLQTVALALIAAGYALEIAQLRRSQGEQPDAAAALVPLALVPAWQRPWSGLFLTLSFVNVALSLFVLLNAVSVHLSTRSTTSLLPVIAFALLLLSNLTLPVAVATASEELFLASKALYLLGLMAFLALAVRVARG